MILVPHSFNNLLVAEVIPLTQHTDVSGVDSWLQCISSVVARLKADYNGDASQVSVWNDMIYPDGELFSIVVGLVIGSPLRSFVGNDIESGMMNIQQFCNAYLSVDKNNHPLKLTIVIGKEISSDALNAMILHSGDHFIYHDKHTSVICLNVGDEHSETFDCNTFTAPDLVQQALISEPYLYNQLWEFYDKCNGNIPRELEGQRLFIVFVDLMEKFASGLHYPLEVGKGVEEIVASLLYTCLDWMQIIHPDLGPATLDHRKIEGADKAIYYPGWLFNHDEEMEEFVKREVEHLPTIVTTIYMLYVRSLVLSGWVHYNVLLHTYKQVRSLTDKTSCLTPKPKHKLSLVHDSSTLLPS